MKSEIQQAMGWHDRPSYKKAIAMKTFKITLSPSIRDAVLLSICFYAASLLLNPLPSLKLDWQRLALSAMAGFSLNGYFMAYSAQEDDHD